MQKTLHMGFVMYRKFAFIDIVVCPKSTLFNETPCGPDGNREVTCA